MATRYVVHDINAQEVDQDTFYGITENGGTAISSAYLLTAEMIERDYPLDNWNLYAFHFSDGDNWSADDTRQCMDILRDRLMPKVNVFCYGQVESPYGSGQFIKDLRERFPEDEKILTSEIPNKESIYKSIKDFLGKGK